MTFFITIFLCGDVMLGRGVDQIMAQSVDPSLHEPFVKDARRYVELAEATGARVVLSGDSAQHAPVARGDALRILESEAGLGPAQLTRIYRQRTAAYREAVEAISSGDRRGVAEGFEKLDAMNAIREVSSQERYAALAEGYLGTVLEEKKTALVVSPTHREGAQVTATIREGLKDAGALDTEEREYQRLRSCGMTEAERGHAGNYCPGLIIQAHDHVPGLKRGRKYEVVTAGEHAVRIRETGDPAARRPREVRRVHAGDGGSRPRRPHPDHKERHGRIPHACGTETGAQKRRDLRGGRLHGRGRYPRRQPQCEGPDHRRGHGT